MVRVIEGQLASPMNAGSLEPGDRIFKGEIDQEIISVSAPRQHMEMAGRHSGSPYVVIRTDLTSFHIGINTPLLRIVGARSGGQIGCS